MDNGAGLWSRDMSGNAMMGSVPLDRDADRVSRMAGSGLPVFTYNPPPALLMANEEGHPITDRPELSGYGGGVARTKHYPGTGRTGNPAMPSYPAFPTPTFTYDLFPQ